jgi:LysM repeat protein
MRRFALAVGLLLAMTVALTAPALAQGGSLPATHVVQPGETLYRIALRYGVTVEALRHANDLTESSVLLSGQTLIIPSGAAAGYPAGARTHRVAQGESLEQIARRYNLTPDALLRANNLTANVALVPGQVLIIPAGSGTADLGLMGVSVPLQPASPPVTDLGILPASGPYPAASPANVVSPASVAWPETAPNPEPEHIADTAPDAAVPAPQAAASGQPLAAADTVAAEVIPSPPETAPISSGPDAALDMPDQGSLSAAQEEAADAAQPLASELSAAQPNTPRPGGFALPPAPVEVAAASPAEEPTVLVVEGETLDTPDLGIIPPDTALWLQLPGLFTAGGPRMREIYERGLALGNNPHAFSKIGDCNSELPFFLGRFDSGDYDLGPYQYLQPVIDYFAGSFGRQNVTVWTGNHAWSVLDPTFANPTLCLPGETPLACEFRLHRPSVVLIRLGTNEAYTPALFEQYLRAILDYSIERGVIPILGTKADQLEGSDAINDIVRRLAAEYQVPLWDFGRIASTLPGRGLRDDGFHMTWYPLTFGDPRALQQGHSVHNLTALIALYTVWQNVLR